MSGLTTRIEEMNLKPKKVNSKVKFVVADEITEDEETEGEVSETDEVSEEELEELISNNKEVIMANKIIKNIKAKKESIVLEIIPGIIRCNTCSKDFKTQAILTKHIKTVHDVIRCEYIGCGNQKFNSNDNLEQHQEIHFEDNKFLCWFNDCGVTFDTRKKVKDHYKKHLTKTYYKCSFIVTNNEVNNDDESNNDESIETKNCGYTFDTVKQLTTHFLTHCNKKKYDHISDPESMKRL